MEETHHRQSFDNNGDSGKNVGLSGKISLFVASGIHM